MHSVIHHEKRALFAIVILLAILGMTTPPVVAQEETYSLKTILVSAPKHAKACEIFKVTYSITNLGPGNVVNLDIQFGVPDQFSVVGVVGTPVNLSVGQRTNVTATIKVVAFVPGESRAAWVMLNNVTTPIKLIGKRVLTCP
jgi:hypothetical protein